MICHIENIGSIDLSKPLDISLAITNDANQVNAFHIPSAQIKPLQAGDFIGSVAEGGPVNCYNVSFNPHGNGTHTECVGHISQQHQSVNVEVKEYSGTAILISVELVPQSNGNRLITLDAIKQKLRETIINPWAIVIRSLPNNISKKTELYSGNNPGYFEPEATEWLRAQGFKHLLTDLPSVDKEEDEGKLLAHHAWWDYPNTNGEGRSITELIYVPDTIIDGNYFLQLHIASMESDASPSRPLLFDII
ncbi:MAG: cyclase family protein [Bacteroidota bacterium]|nr:cyclase family protein [Bacteroidota bacterium]